MPATYSFSLNLSKDRDIIELMETQKNKSLLIRKSLHAYNRVDVYELYIERLEKLIRSYCRELEWECPSFSQLLNRCYKIKEEGKLEIQLSRQGFHNSYQEQE